MTTIRSLFEHYMASSGETVRDFHTSYHLLRDGATWRILSYTNHA